MNPVSKAPAEGAVHFDTISSAPSPRSLQRLSGHLAESMLFRYGLAVLSIALVIGVKFVFQHFGMLFPLTACSVIAVAITVWHGGIGPGLLASALSSVAAARLISPLLGGGPRFLYVFNHLAPVLLVVWISASRRRAERLLDQARNELECKVEERTIELRRVNEKLLAEIAERKRSEEALRASEQVTRGQVEALTFSLDVLATAPEPEKFLGKMLASICRLLSGQSASLWLFDEPTDSLILRLVVSAGSPTSGDREHPLIKDPLSWKANPVIQELLLSAGPVVCEDIEIDPRMNEQWREYFKPKGTRKFFAVPILVGGHVKGMITVRHAERESYRPEEIELTQALAHQVMLAIRLTELGEQSRQTAVLGERNRMARDIHDTLAQGFTGVIVQLEAAEDAISEGDRQEADCHMRRAGDLARQSLSEARRSVHALRPKALEQDDFWHALKGIIKNTTVGTALHTTFEAQSHVPNLPQLWQGNLLRIGQEALTNTLKYAHATNFSTRLWCDAEEVHLELCDDGDGFNLEDRHDGFGLTGMRERVEEMGGELKIASSREMGTRITAILPLKEESML